MIILNKISKSFGNKLLFENVSLNIYDGEKIGIIGTNGSGKSTFLKLLTKEMDLDSGVINTTGTFAYVKQVAIDTIKDGNFNENDFNFLKIKNKIFNNLDSCQNFETLSGGEKTKLMISYSLSKNADTLILDEPTNNLDQESINLLIDKLNAFNGTLLVVSHDRYFLDKTVNKILEFENGKITEYYGGYSEYETQKQELLEYNKKVYEEKLKENKKLEIQIKHLSDLTAKLEKSTKKDGSSDKRAKGYKDSAQQKVKKVARQREAKINRLEKLQNDLPALPNEQQNIFYRIQPNKLNNKGLVKFTDVSKSFENKLLFKNVSFTISAGEKIALLGKNGSGKTTLIKMLLNKENYNGDIWESQSLKFAYLPQNAFDINSDQTVMEFASEFNEYKTQFLTNLCNMGFSRDIFTKKLTNLSSGEKMKIKLNELIVSDFNFLILDEPTNNLDIQNKIFLEKVLSSYNGNLIIVSHDKSFVDNICQSKIIIDNQTIIKQI